MATIKEQATEQYVTKLRELADRAVIDAATFNQVRAFVEGLGKQLDADDSALVLTRDQYTGLQWVLGLLAAYDEVTKDLHQRTTGHVRTILPDDGDDAEQERVGWLTEC